VYRITVGIRRNCFALLYHISTNALLSIQKKLIGVIYNENRSNMPTLKCVT